MLEDKNLIFIHLPKAGGNTLHKVLEREYQHLKEQTYTIHRTAQQDNFKSLPEKKRHAIKLLKGHMHYGMHEYLKGESVYITMLREPVNRFISQFYYSKAVGDDALSVKIRDETITIEDYTKRQLAPWTVNAQTRHLSGVQDFEGSCTEAMFNQAVQHLESSTMIVGLLESFEESLILFKNLLGWKRLPTSAKKNVNTKKEKDISEKTRKLIYEVNHFDIELYRLAQRKFEKQYSHKWDKEVQKLRYANQLNQLKHSIKNVLKP